MLAFVNMTGALLPRTCLIRLAMGRRKESTGMASPKPSEPQARLYLLLEELFNTSVSLHEGVTTRLLTQGTIVGHAEVPHLGGRI